MSDDDLKLQYSFREAAKALGVSRATLYRRIGAGELTPHHWHGKPYFRADALRAYVDRISGAGRPPDGSG